MKSIKYLVITAIGTIIGATLLQSSSKEKEMGSREREEILNSVLKTNKQQGR